MVFFGVIFVFLEADMVLIMMLGLFAELLLTETSIEFQSYDLYLGIWADSVDAAHSFKSNQFSYVYL